MKRIKTNARNRISESKLKQLMMVSLQGPELSQSQEIIRKANVIFNKNKLHKPSASEEFFSVILSYRLKEESLQFMKCLAIQLPSVIPIQEVSCVTEECIRLQAEENDNISRYIGRR